MKAIFIIWCCCVMMMLYGISCRSGSTEGSRSGHESYRPVPVDRQDSLLQEVLDMHDYGMARMMKLSRYRTRAQQLYDSLLRAGHSVQSISQWKQVGEKLAQAEALMQVWMEAFRLDSLQDDPEKRVIYLEGEKRKVQAMKEAIDASLYFADSLHLKK